MKIPVGSKSKFLAAYDDMPSPKETSWVRHKIRRGETVSHIASKYGVSQYAIFEANNLSRRSRIYAGKELIVPVPLDRENKSWRKQKNGEYQAKGSIYSVRGGDTMWDIARAFGTTVAELRRVNSIGRGSRIYVGQKLRIPSSAKKLKDKNIDLSTKAEPVYADKGNGKSGSSAPESTRKYKVRSGDTLWDIARMHGTTTTALRRLNGLGRSSRIYPGQELMVSSTNGPKWVYHKVRRGETLGRIAYRYRTSIARILAVNDINDPDRLSVGQTLRIKQN